MDLGIADRTALICGSSQGLGLACATALAEEGVAVTLNGRHEDKLAKAADLLEQQGYKADWLAADMTTDAGRAKLCEKASRVDILVTNNAGPPPCELESWDHQTLLETFEANMIPATLFIRAAVPAMQARKFGRIINITSAMVKSPKPIMGLSTAARAGLTALSKAISKDVAADNVTINNLLPERIDTPRQAQMARRLMESEQIDRDEAYRRIADTIAAKRLGRPEEFAAACAFLCSQQAGFISGQNLQIDGGSYAGLI